MRAIKLLVILGIVTGCTRTNPSSPERYDYIEVLKDYSTCQCIAFAFKKQGLNIGQKDISIAVSSDLAGMNMPLLKEIDAYMATQVDSIFAEVPGEKSVYQNKAITLRCLHFSRSKILDKNLSARIRAFKSEKYIKQRYPE